MKKLRRVLCAAMAAVTMLSMSVSASADSDSDGSVLLTEAVLSAEPDDEGYVLVLEEESTIGEYQVIDRTYVLSGVSAQSNTSTSQTFKRSRSIYEDKSDCGKLLFIMWVQGTFTWNGDDNITITSPKAWIDYYETGTLKISVKDGYPKYDSNQGANFLFGRKYAYIDYIVSVRNDALFVTDFRLWLDVNVDGNPNVKK